MSEIEQLENVATKAIHRLRLETLASGQPFMINMKTLPADQCYFEYPDHSIQLVTFIPGKNDFFPLKKLNTRESSRLRKYLGL